MADNRLGDFTEIVMGQSPASEMCNTIGKGVPLLNGPTEYGLHHPTPIQYTTDARKQARCGDLLFCVRGSTTGRMNWANREYAIGRGVAAIRHKTNPKLQPFVRAVIEHELPGLLAQATGSTFPNVSCNQISNISWPQLQEKEQLVVAHILGTLNDKIDLNREMTETLEDMARSLFKSWFVDFDPVHAKSIGKPTGLLKEISDLFPSSLYESDLGEIPEGWKIGSFGDIAQQRTERIGGDREAVVLSAVASGKLVRSSDHFNKRVYSKEIFKYLMVERYDFAYNPSRINIGSIGMLEESLLGAVSPVYVVIRPQIGCHWFFEYLIRQPITNEWVNILASGSVRQSLSCKDFLSIPCVLPPQKAIDIFTDFLLAVKEYSGGIEAQTSTLVEMRDTISPKLISGEIRVGA